MPASEETVLGFLGTGAIGAPIARRLLGAERKMVVFDPRREALEPFSETAEIGTSPQDVAMRADIVFGCLPSAETYREAILGSQGVSSGTRARIYVHLGTTGAAHVRELSEALSSCRIVTLDAPVTGGVVRACDGTLTTMVCGPGTAIDSVETYMRRYASLVIRLGTQPGAAQIMKLVNNAVSLTNLGAACEALVVGAKAGLDPAAMLEVLNSGSGQNSATLMKIPQCILTGTFNFGGALRIVVKDLKAFLDEAAGLGIDTPIVGIALQSYLNAVAFASESGDVTEVIRPMERSAGIEVRVAQKKP